MGIYQIHNVVPALMIVTFEFEYSNPFSDTLESVLGRSHKANVGAALYSNSIPILCIHYYPKIRTLSRTYSILSTALEKQT